MVGRVLSGLMKRLLVPDLVAGSVGGYAEAVAEQRRDAERAWTARREHLERCLAGDRGRCLTRGRGLGPMDTDQGKAGLLTVRVDAPSGTSPAVVLVLSAPWPGAVLWGPSWRGIV
jgi:hypothetical protein